MPTLIDNLLEGLSGVGYALDTPGALARGALAGRPGERASGRDMLESWGVLGRNQEGLDAGDVAGFAADMVLDPLNLVGGAGIKKLLSGGDLFAGLPADALNSGLGRLSRETLSPPGGINDALAWAKMNGVFPEGEADARNAVKLFEYLRGQEPPIPGALPNKSSGATGPRYGAMRPGNEYHALTSAAGRGQDAVYQTGSSQSPNFWESRAGGAVGPTYLPEAEGFEHMPFDTLQHQYSGVVGRGASKLSGIDDAIRQHEDRLLAAHESPLEDELRQQLEYRGRDFVRMNPPEGVRPDSMQARDTDFVSELRGEDRLPDRMTIQDDEIAPFGPLGDTGPDLGVSRLERSLALGEDFADPYFSDELSRHEEEVEKLLGIIRGEDARYFSPEINSMIDDAFNPAGIEALNRALRGIEATVSGSPPKPISSPLDDQFLATANQLRKREAAEAMSGIGHIGRADLARGERVAAAMPHLDSPDPLGLSENVDELERLWSERPAVESALEAVRTGGVEGDAVTRFLSPDQLAQRSHAMDLLSQRRDAGRAIQEAQQAQVRRSWGAPLGIEFGRSMDPDRLRELAMNPRFYEALREASGGRMSRRLMDEAGVEMQQDYQTLADAGLDSFESILGAGGPINRDQLTALLVGLGVYNAGNAMFGE